MKSSITSENNEQLCIYNYKFKQICELFDMPNAFSLIAGPCSVESLEQMEEISKVLVDRNIKFIRGGAYKPRTSPYDFQGLEREGLEILDYVRKKFNLLIVSEIVDPRDVELGIRYTDIIQIGSRNMHNYALLKEVGKTSHPVLLKRGFMSTLKEFLLAAEYIVSNGNTNIIMCERGIRTFEDSTRNTLDISSIAMIKRYTNLPVIADISHALGRTDIAITIAKALKAMDINGIMVEIHNNPKQALSDNEQQMDLEDFVNFCNNLL